MLISQKFHYQIQHRFQKKNDGKIKLLDNGSTGNWCRVLNKGENETNKQWNRRIYEEIVGKYMPNEPIDSVAKFYGVDANFEKFGRFCHINHKKYDDESLNSAKINKLDRKFAQSFML